MTERRVITPTGPGSPLPSRVVAFDLETTGLLKDKDRIVEFCFLELDAELREVGRWTQRVNPGVPIPPEATEVHGIRDEDVAHLPAFASYAPRVQRLVTDAVLVAYHHEFDRDLLHYELERAGQPGVRADHPFIDPFRIFRAYYPHKLEGAVRLYLDRPHEGAHGALADVRATVDVLRAQRDRHGLGAGIDGLLHRDEVTWLDRDKRVYVDEDGVARFSFGRYRDEPVLEHLDYVKWIMNGAEFTNETKRALAEMLARAGKSA